MDPNLLPQDELELELDIRDIRKNDPHALKVLCEMVEEEFSGKREPPNKLHSWYRTATSEAAELNWKKSSIVITTGDTKEIAQCRSRVIHLQGRATRLSKHAEQNVHVKNLQHELGRILEKCTMLLSESLSTEGNTGAAAVSIDISPPDAKISNSVVPSEDSSQASGRWVLPVSYSKPFSGVSLSAQGPSTNDVIELDKVESKNVSPQGPSTSQTHAIRDQQPVSAANMNQYIEALVRMLAAGNIALPSADDQPASIPADPIPPPPASIPSASHFRPPPSSYGQGLHPPAVVPQVWAMAKWPLRFSGGPKDLPVDEFVFRVETLARLSFLPQAALTLGLHQLLTGAASSWYWVYIKNEPNSSWNHTRRALALAFPSTVSDAAIRRMIMDRVQRPGERFTEFLLAIQELEVRLGNRMSELDLVETLKRNMLPHVQDRLLFMPVQSIQDLQQCVHMVEELAQSQSEVQHLRRGQLRIHELVAPLPVPDEYVAMPPPNYDWTVPPPPGMRFFPPQQLNPDQEIGALSNEYTRCWNCDELGHTYLDCSANRIIFCYGCGEKKVIRPQCPRCSVRALQGNGRGSVRPVGSLPIQPRQERSALQYPHQRPHH